MRQNVVLYGNFTPNSETLGTAPASGSTEYWATNELLKSAQRTVKKFASFDADGIDLTDTSLAFAATGDNIGYVSKTISSADGSFPTYPAITITLSGTGGYSCSGITFHFNCDICTKVNVIWFYDNTLVSSATFSPDALDYFCEKEVASYNKVHIYFRNTEKPFQAVKLNGIDLGNEVKITDFIGNISIFEEISPDFSDAPGNTCDFEAVINDDVSPQQGQTIDVYSGGDYFGRFYVDSAVKTAKNRYRFECSDAIMNLDGVTMPTIAAFDGTYIVTDIAYKISTAAKVTRCSVTTNGGNSLKGFIESGTTARTAAAMLGFAARAFVTDARSKTINYVAPRKRYGYVIPESRILGNASYNKKVAISKATLNMYASSFSDAPSSFAVGWVRSAAESIDNVLVYDRYSLYQTVQANLLSGMSNLQSEITARIIYQDERVGDILSVVTKYDGIRKGVIKSMQLNIGASITADIVMIERG